MTGHRHNGLARKDGHDTGRDPRTLSAEVLGRLRPGAGGAMTCGRRTPCKDSVLRAMWVSTGPFRARRIREGRARRRSSHHAEIGHFVSFCG